jgi:RimJ/RimL family protein N-acetyltransferase
MENSLHELKFVQYERVRPLFRKMDMHLPLQAILAGNVNAPIFVDSVMNPQSAITWSGHRFYLAGAPGNNNFISTTRQIFFEKFALRSRKSGLDSYQVYYPPSTVWESTISAMLLGKYPIKAQREYYAFKSSRLDWKALLPAGVAIRNVDAAFLVEKRWKNPEFLTDEMLSERESVDDFLAKSFGVCAVQADEIIGWCLSEYNTGHRCEVGIATHAQHQRQGLATALAVAFIELARSKDVARVGWHCAASNVASGRTALKAGFEKVSDYSSYFGWFDDASNMAGNAYFAHGRGEYAQALAFYEKSFALGEAPDQAYWGAACDAAMLGENEMALKYLAEAVERGYDDPEQIKSSKYLVGLHKSPGWKAILKRL